MDKKKLTIILSACCAVALIVAIFLIAKPKNNSPVISNPNENNPNTNIENPIKTPENVPGDNKVYVDDVRKDGNQELTLMVDGEDKGLIKTIVKDSTFYIEVEGLNKSGAIDLKIDGENITNVKESTSIVIGANKTTITTKHDEAEGEAEDVADNSVEENEEVKETESVTEYEIVGYIKDTDKYYISEKSLAYIVNVHVNNKAITINTGAKQEEITANFSKIEDVLRNEELVDFTSSDRTALANKIFDSSFDFKISSFGPVNKEISENDIKDVIFNAFANESNIIYSKKAGNKSIVMFNSSIAKSLMNVILPSVSHKEVYANVRLLIETDDSGKITNIYGDSYYIFDGQDIYYYITLTTK